MCKVRSLYICILLFSNVFTDANAFDIDLHKQTNNKCLSCHHQDQIKQNSTAGESSKDQCQSCHNLGLSELQTVGANQSGLVPTIPKNTTVILGMRYPMYPKGTRLGDDPNKMVLIPAGEFIMGTNDRLPDEGPKHEVILPAYYIDIYEVTNLQYKKFNNATNRRSPAHFRNRTYPEGKADHPVTYVSWEDAREYCKWAGKRLPTDQEWEKAARGTDGKMFPWGETFDVKKANTPLRWQQLGVFGDTTPVGSFEKGVSVYGIYDMSGNVWEWTESWYAAYPGNTVSSESYGERYKTLKGGSWFDCSFYKCGISAPVFNRAFFAKRTKNDSFGFRCAKDAK